MNRLFVVNKPIFISSNNYMYHIKRRYSEKKVGFSGTLDPFATGSLIVGTGQYTKLFRFLKKSPKSYRATMWLGAVSETLDIEKVSHIKTVKPFDIKSIEDALYSTVGNIEYLPPKYSAKKVDGKRAYDLARSGKDVDLKIITSTIYSIKMLHYKHPFVTFEIEVSEGAYIRSIAQILAKKLKVDATLSGLHRLNEGRFRYQNEKMLNPIEYLNIPKNRYFGDKESLRLGKKQTIDSFEKRKDGKYYIAYDDFLSVIEIKNQEVKYLLNDIRLNS